MTDFVSIYSGSGYGMAYSLGDTIYAFGIFMATCILIAGYILQSQREGFSVHDQPKCIVMLGFIGICYVLLFPCGFMIFMGLVVISQHLGHHGQWIGIACANIAAWIFFWNCIMFRKFH